MLRVGSQVDGVYVKYITVNGGPAVYYDAAGNTVHYNQGGTGAPLPRVAFRSTPLRHTFHHACVM